MSDLDRLLELELMRLSRDPKEYESLKAKIEQDIRLRELVEERINKNKETVKGKTDMDWCHDSSLGVADKENHLLQSLLDKAKGDKE